MLLNGLHVLFRQIISCTLLWYCFFSLNIVFGQDLEFSAIGTGRTTGHIADLTIRNVGKIPHTAEIGPLYIPSDGKHQSYIVPDSYPINLIPGNSIVVSISGFCTDIYKPPVPMNVDMIPFDQWVQIDENNLNNVPTMAHHIQVNPNDHPQLVASYYYSAITTVAAKYQELSEQGKIRTPFSSDQEKEKESVLQQVIWIYAAEIHDDPYTFEDFKGKTLDQFEEKMNTKVDELPEGQKEQLEQSVVDFWTSFELVGTEAKIFRERDDGPQKIIEPEFNPEVIPDPEPDCSCTKCRFADKFILENTETGERYSDSIPPNTNIRFITPPLLESDCSKDCELTTRASFDIKIYESCQLVLGAYDRGSGYTRTIGDAGYIELEFRGSCTCDYQLCGSVEINQTITIKEENPCCQKVRCQNTNDYPLPMRFTNPDAPDQFVELDGNQLSFGANGETHSQDFNFDVESLFCQLKKAQIIGQTEIAAIQRNLGEAQTSYDITMSGPFPNDEDSGSGYVLSFGKSKLANDDLNEYSVSFFMNKNSCRIMAQITFNNKVYEFIR